MRLLRKPSKGQRSEFLYRRTGFIYSCFVNCRRDTKVTELLSKKITYRGVEEVKAREFWINIDDTDNGDKVFESPQDGRYYIHVREVVKIDWAKVWRESEANLYPLDMLNIKKSVEAQLKGEE